MADNLTKTEVIYFEEIAKHLAKGLEPDQVAIETNLDLEFVNRCIAHPEFDQIFGQIDPRAYELWRESQLDLIAKRRVKTMAREDAPGHYKDLKTLVATSADLDDKQKADLLVKLITMSGVIDKEVEQETVIFSESQLANILEAIDETS